MRQVLVSHKLRNFQTGDAELDRKLNEHFRDPQALLFEKIRYFDTHTPDHDLTEAEIAAGVTPTNFQYPPGDVRRYGAVGDGVTNDSAAVQAAIDVGMPVFVYHGTYMCSALTADTDYQTFHFYGRAILRKNANGALLTVNGDRTAFFNARFDGQGFTGDNLVKVGVHMTLAFCSSYNAAGRAVLDNDGNGLRILGTNDIYHTSDATASGYDIEIAGSGIYSKVTDIYTSQATGGIFFNQTGSGGGHSVAGGQFGKLTFIGGSGASAVTNCRINGAMTIEKSGVTLDVCSCSANVTIGDGSTTFAGISIGHSFIMQSGTTFTATAGLQNCTLYVDQLQENGVTVDFSNLATDNFLYTALASYTSAWTATGTAPAIGDGTIGAFYQRSGRNVKATITLSFGATTTYGTGTWRHSLPFTVGSVTASFSPAKALDSGTNFRVGISIPQLGVGYATSVFDSAATETTLAVPHAWASGDTLALDVEYYV